MKTATAFSTVIDTRSALSAAYADLTEKLGGPPTWMTVHTTDAHPADLVVATLGDIAPGVPFQGGTSCQGVMTETGYHSNDGVSLGLFGIYDPDGVYSIGWSAVDGHSYLAGRDVIRQARAAAGQDKPPALIWITCAPGDEEALLVGIEEGLDGASVPIIGGSSADNTISGNWYQFTNDTVLRNGIVITALYPSTRVRYAFDNGYSPTEQKGYITKVAGRTVYEINRRPAAEVYNEWTNGAISDYMAGGNILAPSTLYPLGRSAEWTSGITFYQLSHPEAVHEDGALSLFTTAQPGDRIVLMESTIKGLVNRVDRITSAALAGMRAPSEQIAGALIIYCAGCMLAVQDNLPDVVERFNGALANQPFLGLYTFGEQGCAAFGENVHANLMMSIIVFER